MNTAVVRTPSAHTLLRLGRVSNLPTVWTNVVAGATIANAASAPADIATIGLSMTAFYVGGMYLNDFFDREIDAKERPGRPIHAGDIGAATVAAIGFALLAAGMALLAPFGPLTAVLALALAAAIVLYDAWHKGNSVAPVIMGLCRALVYLATGAAVSGSIAPVADRRRGRARCACHRIDLRRKAGKPEPRRPPCGRLPFWPFHCCLPCPAFRRDGSSSLRRCCCARPTSLQ